MHELMETVKEGALNIFDREIEFHGKLRIEWVVEP